MLLYKKVVDVGDQNGENRHQYFTIVTNTFRLQHPSPISVNNIEPPKSPPMEVLHKVTKNAAMIRKANDHKKDLLTRPVEFVTSFDTNNMPKNIFENSISSIFIFVDFLALFLTHFQRFRSFKLQSFSKIENFPGILFNARFKIQTNASRKYDKNHMQGEFSDISY